MNNFETHDRADEIVQSMTPYAMAKRIIELEEKQQAPEVPDGWRLVPVKLTDEMSSAIDMNSMCDPNDQWDAALSAAPQPPAVGDCDLCQGGAA